MIQKNSQEHSASASLFFTVLLIHAYCKSRYEQAYEEDHNAYDNTYQHKKKLCLGEILSGLVSCRKSHDYHSEHRKTRTEEHPAYPAANACRV